MDITYTVFTRIINTMKASNNFNYIFREFAKKTTEKDFFGEWMATTKTKKMDADEWNS